MFKDNLFCERFQHCMVTLQNCPSRKMLPEGTIIIIYDTAVAIRIKYPRNYSNKYYGCCIGLYAFVVFSIILKNFTTTIKIKIIKEVIKSNIYHKNVLFYRNSYNKYKFNLKLILNLNWDVNKKYRNILY